MIDPDRRRDQMAEGHGGAATTPGWRLDVKVAALVAVAMLVVILALSLLGYGGDDLRPGREVAPATDTDAGRVSGVEVESR